MSTDDPARISPTAHYTGYTWYRHGLSHKALVTPQGRALYAALRPFNAVSRRLGTPSLDGLLLARHRAIDAWLEQAIESGQVTQIIEIAAGLSPRGWDFTRRHGSRIEYVEADLPAMAAYKLKHLQRAGLLGPRHRVVALDALADSGPDSLAALTTTLDRTQGTVIVTEGLLNYFPRKQVLGMWRRFANALQGFPQGLYLSDLHVASDNRGLFIQAFLKLLSSFVRGAVHLHFSSALEARSELQQMGFKTAEVVHPPGGDAAKGSPVRAGARLVRVVRAGV